MKVERIDLPKELTEKLACEFIGRLASVCTGKELENDAMAEKIGRMNLTEHLGKPTRCWEFLPIRFVATDTYSNFRGGLNSEITTASLCVLYNRDLFHAKKDYHLFKISVPKYVRDHVKTHTKLSSISSSARIGIDKEKLYEFPEVEKRNQNVYSDFDLSTLKFNNGSYFYSNKTHKQFSETLERFYNRKEIIKRSLSDFEVVDMVIGGYFDEGWDNFIKVRTASCDGTFICPNEACEKPCIQKETRELALLIKGLVEDA